MTCTSRPARRSAYLLMLAVGLMWSGSSAIAQSSYTLTTLGKPASAVSYAPVTLDKAGTVRGGMFSVTGTRFDPMQGCYFCSLYTDQDVNWGSGTGSTASAVRGLSAFFTLRANDNGLQVGSYSPGKYRRDPINPTIERAGSPRDVGNRGFYPGQLATVRNGILSTLAFPARVNSMSLGGVNNLGWIALTADEVAPLSSGAATQAVGVIYRNGTYARLDSTGYGTPDIWGINDAGTVVGTVVRDDVGGTGRVPAVWINDRIAHVGDAALTDSRPMAVNAAGQVLLRVGEASQLWLNGALTPIEGPAGRSVQATALNDAGTVVGCTQAITGGVARRADFTPFIWKNGVMQDLAQVVAANGVKLPSGTKLGCPWAINQNGSILTYHYRTSNEAITWVRLNARP